MAGQCLRSLCCWITSRHWSVVQLHMGQEHDFIETEIEYPSIKICCSIKNKSYTFTRSFESSLQFVSS